MSYSGYMSFVENTVVAFIRLMHQPQGYPPRCGYCGMRWPCDRLRRLDEIERQQEGETP